MYSSLLLIFSLNCAVTVATGAAEEVIALYCLFSALTAVTVATGAAEALTALY